MCQFARLRTTSTMTSGTIPTHAALMRTDYFTRASAHQEGIGAAPRPTEPALTQTRTIAPAGTPFATRRALELALPVRQTFLATSVPR
jgi:hypothetical protein